MPIIREITGHECVSALDAAWQAPETFAFLPGKTAVDEEWVRASLDHLPAHLATGHFALLTSGSTGQPKLVIGQRARAESLVRTLHAIQESRDVVETILTLPLSYSYAFVNQWLWARVHQKQLVLTEGFGHPQLLGEILKQAESAMLCFVGAQLPLMRASFPDAIFPGVTRVHFAGGPFPQVALAEMRYRFPNARVFNNYGCAEAMPRLTFRQAEASEVGSNVGVAIPGVDLRLGDDGQLQFLSRYGAKAFVDADGLRELKPGEWCPTGDLAQRQTDGSWQLLGRANQVFKRFGEKISTANLLETVDHGGWDGIAHFYREIDVMNEEGYVLILSPAPAEAQLRQILLAFRRRHPRTHWPLRVESIHAVPELPSGKPDLIKIADAANKTVHWTNRL